MVEAEKVRACLTALVVLRQIAGALVQWSAGPASSFSASPMPWEQPRKMRPASAPLHQCTGDLAERGQRGEAGAHLLSFNEEVLLKLSKLCDRPSSTN